MLIDAFRAEGFRLAANRTAVFWSIVFLPVMIVIAAALGAWADGFQSRQLDAALTPPNGGPSVIDLLSSTPLNLGASLLDNMSKAPGPFLMLFFLIGMTSVWAADYRFETWRLIIARNSRVNLIVGKIAVVAMLAVIVMLTATAAELIGDVVTAGITQRPLAFAMTNAEIGRMAALAGLGWLRLMQFAMLGLLTAIVSRSMLATLFVPLVVTVAQALAPMALLGLLGVTPDSWLTQMLSPGSAFDGLKTLLEPAAPQTPVAADLALRGWLSILIWTAGPLVGALTLFKRQDLSKE